MNGLNKVGVKKNFLNLITVIHNKLLTTIILNNKTEEFPLKSGISQAK
jgi:hypothetical protein